MSEEVSSCGKCVGGLAFFFDLIHDRLFEDDFATLFAYGERNGNDKANFFFGDAF